jgi:hypothetical protein
MEERIAAADAAVDAFHIRIPVVVNGIADDFNDAYAAWPERCFVIAGGGTVAFIQHDVDNDDDDEGADTETAWPLLVERWLRTHFGEGDIDGI